MKKKKSKQKQKKKIKIRPDWKWIWTIFGMTIGISAAMAFFSGEILSASSVGVSFVVLLSIILLGIIFDIIGVAVTAASDKPFHSMASKKIPEAQTALRLLKRADRVSSICNDVVGDICGVVSGSASAVIAVEAFTGVDHGTFQLIQLFMSALVAALTVGGKAFGKSIAMNNSTEIIHVTAKIIYTIRSVPKRLTKLFRKV